MLRRNLQIFFLFLVIALLLILFKESQIFDLGWLARKINNPQKITNQLLAPPDNLNEEYQKLLAVNSRLQALEQENKTLREFFDFKETKNYQLVIANILGRDNINQNLLIIDVGDNKKIQTGQAVVVNDGIIIGKVLKVNSDSAIVRLLIDNQSKLAVAVGSTQQISGLLTGLLGLGMNLSFIPQEQEMKKGDMVVTNNLNDQIPAGLAVGTVEEIEFSNEELFKTASVSTLLDYSTLSLVAVITSP